MFDFLLSEEEKVLQAEARRFAKEDVPSSLIRDMDGERIRYPKEFLQKAVSRNLLGLRFSPVWGGRGGQVGRRSGRPGRDRRARLELILSLFS